MKTFEEVSFNTRQCNQELNDFRKLLQGQPTLREREHLKPFFEQAKQLSAFIGTYVPDIGPANLLAFEFEIEGDFVADIVVGNRENQTFCMVELEEASPRGIFVTGRRSAPEWSRRFEHGFSQLVDWFYALDDSKRTDKFANSFGYGHAKFHGLLVIGRSDDLSPRERNRLRWRGERVLVNSHPINCVTYDELHEDLSRRLDNYTAAASGEQSGF